MQKKNYFKRFLHFLLKNSKVDINTKKGQQICMNLIVHLLSLEAKGKEKTVQTLFHHEAKSPPHHSITTKTDFPRRRSLSSTQKNVVQNKSLFVSLN